MLPFLVCFINMLLLWIGKTTGWFKSFFLFVCFFCSSEQDSVNGADRFYFESFSSSSSALPFIFCAMHHRNCFKYFVIPAFAISNVATRSFLSLYQSSSCILETFRIMKDNNSAHRFHYHNLVVIYMCMRSTGSHERWYR